jgi:TolA-binding protein
MSVVSIHPEDLLDKLGRGELTPGERELLSAHLESCDVCRFELAVSVDLQDEAKLLTLVEPPRLFPTVPVPSRVSKAPERRRPRVAIWALAAALLITATGAVASVTPVGRSFIALLRGQPVTSSVASASAPTASTPRVRRAPRVEGPVTVMSSPRPSSAPSSVSPPAYRTPRPAQEARGSAAPAGVAQAETAASLFADANQARRRGDSNAASTLYRRLQSEYPRSPEAELSQVTLSMALLDRGDAAGALAGFDAYLSRPRRGLEAEALVGRARALRALGSRDAEAVAWREVLRRYPSSVYAKQATERLSALGRP